MSEEGFEPRKELHHTPISREQLERAAREYNTKPEAAQLFMEWRIQELEKRANAGTWSEQLEMHFETANTLRDLGLIQDAREMYDDIADMTEEMEDDEFYDRAIEELDKLPTLH